MTKRQKISDMHAGIVVALLDKQRMIQAQLNELTGMLCRQYGVDDDWLLMGNLQDGFILAPPADGAEDGEGQE